MAYFPASCDHECKDCSQNKCGWCAFRDCPVISVASANPYNYSATIKTIKEEDKMKTPDKIYVASGTTGIGGLCGLWFADMESDLPQYIRKDALVEWLEGEMTIEGATEGFVGGYDSALKDVIRYINSM